MKVPSCTTHRHRGCPRRRPAGRPHRDTSRTTTRLLSGAHLHHPSPERTSPASCCIIVKYDIKVISLSNALLVSYAYLLNADAHPCVCIMHRLVKRDEYVAAARSINHMA